MGAFRREGSNSKMSSQKARAILHWFSARYDGDSPIFLSLLHIKKSTAKIRLITDPFAIRAEISSLCPATSSQASLWGL
jgi:hypothetical protein